MRNTCAFGKNRETVSQFAVMVKGFTLLEITIVFAVVGIILAGVFVAASAAQYRIRLNQGLDEINLIVQNMHALYGGQNEVQQAASQSTQGFALTTTLVNQGIFPPEMLVPTLPSSGIPVAGTVANNPWDQTNVGGSVQIKTLKAYTPTQFIIRFFNIPSDVCVDLLVHNSLPGPETGLQEIAVGALTYSGSSLPLTPITAATTCPVGTLSTIDWYYTLGS